MSDEEIKKWRSIRGAYKGHCTQDFKRAEKLITSESPDQAELEALVDRLTRRAEELARMDAKIVMSLETEEDIQLDTETALSFQDDISYWQFKIGRLLKSKQDTPVSQFHYSSLKQEPAPRMHVNLPKINIKSFGGDPLQWLTFWDSYSAAIDKNHGLSDIEKMNYLNGMLKGEAARAISGLPLTEENYKKAIELLKERFGKPQILTNAYMESLSKIDAPPADTKNLRTFYDTCEANIRGLEALGVKTETYGSLLIPILLKKIPEEIRYSIFRADPSADSSLDRLRIAMRQEIETREKGHMSSPKATTEDEVFVPTAGALLTGTQQRRGTYNAKQKTPRPCTYCAGTHRPDRCDKIKTVEERRSLLQRQQRCLNCLGLNHTKIQCFSKGRCMKCKKKHHTSICDENQENTTQNASSQIKDDKEQKNDQLSADSVSKNRTHMGATHVLPSKAHILMQSAVTKISGNNKQYYQARILFDTGSQRTFITQEMKHKLKLGTMGSEVLDVTTFGTLQGRRKTYDLVTLSLSTEVENIKITALVTPVICPPLSAKVKNLQIPPELQGLKLADPSHASENLKVDIIIGNDYYGQLITGKVIKTQNEALIAMESKFGWLLSGPIYKGKNVQSNLTTLCQRVGIMPVEDEKLDNLLTKFWEINQIPEENKQDEEIIRKFQETIWFNEATGRYNVKLPWKLNKHDLPANYNLSKSRLSSLQNSLNRKDPELITKYNEQLLEQLNLGFIEKVQNLDHHEGVLHYMPHFPVFKSDSATTKMRIVYDASARMSPKSPSLNDCLHTGPNLMQDLTGILLKFRTHKKAFSADIEKAFLQIELNSLDRDATRFLWLKDINQPVDSKSNLEAYRFCRVLFGATPSPFLLNATIQYHLSQKDNWVARDLMENMYMDNVITGTDCDNKSLECYSLSRRYLQEAGMNLRQWTSNSEALNRKAQEDNIQAALTTKILGLTWNSTSDTLSLSIEKMIRERDAITKITKRTTLSFASKLFDPLGFVEPITVKAKIMIQDLWKQTLSWDESLPAEQKEQWLKWTDDIHNLTSIEVPRQYFFANVTKTQLHIFCDSSQQAYGAVAYLRGLSADNGINTAFLMAKTRVAPLKTTTLPRLELLAALLGAKLFQYLNKTLELVNSSEVMYWSDSQIVLSWLSSNKQLQQFVRTRVHKIQELTSSQTWRFCPTSMNPADLITRGVSTIRFNDKKKLWFEGPPWLSEPEEQWPPYPQNLFHEELQSLQMEIVTNVADDPNILNIIDITRYSTLVRLLRVTARVINFSRKWRKRKVYSETFTAKDIVEARNVLLKATQHKIYRQEIPYLKNKDKSRQPPIIRQLDLYLDDEDIIRCRGRLQYTDLPHFLSSYQRTTT